MGKHGKAPAAPAKALPAQGAAGKKRTPQSAFDGAAGKDIYEPELIVGKCLAKGVTKFLVKWAGYDSKHNTWEPIEHLAGCEDLIAQYQERETQRHAELDMVATAKRLEKQTVAAQKAKEDAEAAAAARVAAQEAGSRVPAATVAPENADDGAELKVKREDGGRRSAPIWTCFDTRGAPVGHACCKLLTATGQVCGESISVKTGPAGLWNHALYKHKSDFVRIKGAGNALNLHLDPQTRLPAVSTSHRDAIHRAIARWLVKRKRPLSLPEDPEFHDLFRIAMKGSYTPPMHHTINANVLMLSAEGQKKLFDINTKLRAAGIKPAMAGDIWSDNGVSVLGICEYYMKDDWTIHELVLAASPFSERHTAEAIAKKTTEACITAGLSNDVKSTVFVAVSDNGANMVAGWAGFGRTPCVVHTGQLSVHFFLGHTHIQPTRAKSRGITSHFSFSTGVDGLGALKGCQRECNLPEHHPVKDNDTRWYVAFLPLPMDPYPICTPFTVTAVSCNPLTSPTLCALILGAQAMTKWNGSVFTNAQCSCTTSIMPARRAMPIKGTRWGLRIGASISRAWRCCSLSLTGRSTFRALSILPCLLCCRPRMT